MCFNLPCDCVEPCDPQEDLYEESVTKSRKILMLDLYSKQVKQKVLYEHAEYKYTKIQWKLVNAVENWGLQTA